MPISQTNRPIAFMSPLGDDVLVLIDVSLNEQLGTPFNATVSLVSENDAIDPLTILRQPVSVRIGDADAGPTFISGYVSQFSLIGFNRGLYDYRATVVPWIELLRQVGGSQVFQQQTAVEIAKTVIETRGFSGELDDRLTQTYRQRAYCVQYNESDFNFLSRLFEEEGIYYYFEHTADKHTLVLCDDVSAHQAVAGLETLPYHHELGTSAEACVAKWSHTRRFSTSSCVLRDYDFQKPRVDLTVRQNAADTASTWQWYSYPGGFFESDDGQHYARVRTEAASVSEQTAQVETGEPALRCGNLLTIEQHVRDDINQEYLISATQTHISGPAVAPGSSGSGGLSCHCSLSLQPSSAPFRASQVAFAPTMRGPQVATVVGPSGEEIWTDSFGRVKVQFAWDLMGTGDDTSSCWIRVTQPWTGKGWGAVSIPRVGEEVIVEFLDGNVDRPIVTGRVFNADRMPPEALPDGQAKTVFRTHSTKDGDVSSFHELTFDDTKDAEIIYFRSEKDFERIVENNDSLKIGFEKQDAGDQTIEIYNNQNVAIGIGSGSGSQTIEIGQDRTTTIDSGNDSLTIKQGDLSVTASAGGITLEGQSSIKLKCGGSSIELSASGISIQSGGEMTIKGSIVQIN